MASTSLSEEQKRRIAENRAKALARRAETNERNVTHNSNESKPGPKKDVPPARNKNTLVFSFYSNKQDATAGNEKLNKKAGPGWVGVPVSQVENTSNGSDNAKKNTENIQSKNSYPLSVSRNIPIRSSVQHNNGFGQKTNVRPSSSKRPVGMAANSAHTVGFSAQIPPSKGSGIPGSCVLVSREQFEVVVGFFAPLVEIFKQMKTKVYGKRKVKTVESINLE